jgi:hypothetical protein
VVFSNHLHFIYMYTNKHVDVLEYMWNKIRHRYLWGIYLSKIMFRVCWQKSYIHIRCCIKPLMSYPNRKTVRMCWDTSVCAIPYHLHLHKTMNLVSVLTPLVLNLINFYTTKCLFFIVNIFRTKSTLICKQQNRFPALLCCRISYIICRPLLTFTQPTLCYISTNKIYRRWCVSLVLIQTWE